MKPGDIIREIYQAAVEIPEPFSSLSEDEKQSARRLMSRFEERKRSTEPFRTAKFCVPCC
jgi:hypothetical protein